MLGALREHHPDLSGIEDRELVERVVLGSTAIEITLRHADLPEAVNGAGTITIP